MILFFQKGQRFVCLIYNICKIFRVKVGDKVFVLIMLKLGQGVSGKIIFIDIEKFMYGEDQDLEFMENWNVGVIVRDVFILWNCYKRESISKGRQVLIT